MAHKMLNDIVHTQWMVRGCGFTLVFAGSEDLFYFVECISWFGRIPDYIAAASDEVESPRQLCWVFQSAIQHCDIRSSHNDVLHEEPVFWTITLYRMVSSWTVGPYRWRHYTATLFYSKECSWLTRHGKSPNSRDDGGGKHRSCQKHEPVSLLDLLATDCRLLGILFITSLKSNLCAAVTTQNTTENNPVMLLPQNTTALEPNVF